MAELSLYACLMLASCHGSSPTNWWKPLPVAPACVMIADIGMVLMMVVVPGLVVLGDTLLMPRMVGLVPAPLACVVVMMVVGLPSAEVTSFRMVPAGRGPLVCKEKQVEKG